MSTHNICFYGELEKIILKISPKLLLKNSSDIFLMFLRKQTICIQYQSLFSPGKNKKNITNFSSAEFTQGAKVGLSHLTC